AWSACRGLSVRVMGFSSAAGAERLCVHRKGAKYAKKKQGICDQGQLLAPSSFRRRPESRGPIHMDSGLRRNDEYQPTYAGLTSGAVGNSRPIDIPLRPLRLCGKSLFSNTFKHT